MTGRGHFLLMVLELWKTPSNIYLVCIYSTSASEKNYVPSKNSLNANFALSEMQFQKLLYVGTWLIKYIGKKS